MAYNEVLFNKEIEGLRKVNSEVADRLLFDDKPKDVDFEERIGR